jgi:hypothetical protein
MAKEKCIKVLGVVPLLRAGGREEESQVGLVLPEGVRPSEAEPMILPRTPVSLEWFVWGVRGIRFILSFDHGQPG